MWEHSTPSDRRHITPKRTSRRRFIQTIGAGTVVASAGCVSNPFGGGGGDEISIDPPWTLEELRDAAEEEGGEFTAYVASKPDIEQKQVQAIKEGLSMDADFLTMDTIQGGDSELGQRLMQEAQQGQAQADIGSGMGPPLRDESFRDEYVEGGLTENYESFQPILDQEIILDYMIKPNKIQVGYGMVYHIPQWEAAGYPIEPLEQDYLHAIASTDTYDGLSMIYNVDPDWAKVGSFLEVYAPKMGMGNDMQGWVRELLDGLDLKAVASHSEGVRQSISGEAPAMLWTFARYGREFRAQGADVRTVWPEKVHVGIGFDGIFHLLDSPNPWASRFYMAALMEKPVQEKLLEYLNQGEYSDMPARRDLDFSGMPESLRNFAGQGVTEIEIVDPAKTRELDELGRDVLQPVHDELGLT